MVKDLMKWIGKEVIVKLENLYVLCQVMDVKEAYGKTLYQVSPLAGSGKIWKEFVVLSKEA